MASVSVGDTKDFRWEGGANKVAFIPNGLKIIWVQKLFKLAEAKRSITQPRKTNPQSLYIRFEPGAYAKGICKINCLIGPALKMV